MQFAKVSQACRKEAVILNEALKANADELESSEKFLKSAEAAYELLMSSQSKEDREDTRMTDALHESMQAMRPESQRLHGQSPAQS